MPLYNNNLQEIFFQIQDIAGPQTSTGYTDEFVPCVFDKSKFSGYKGIYFRASLSQSNAGTFAVFAQLYNATAASVITGSEITASLAQFGRSIQEVEISALLPNSAAAIWTQLKAAAGGGSVAEGAGIVVRY